MKKYGRKKINAILFNILMIKLKMAEKGRTRGGGGGGGSVLGKDKIYVLDISDDLALIADYHEDLSEIL